MMCHSPLKKKEMETISGHILDFFFALEDANRLFAW